MLSSVAARRQGRHFGFFSTLRITTSVSGIFTPTLLGREAASLRSEGPAACVHLQFGALQVLDLIFAFDSPRQT